MPIPKPNERYTYQDYCTWPDEERWELIGGIAYDMTPAPTFLHQTVAGNIFRLLGNALQGKSCVPGIAPVDVVLSEEDVVQPDVFVVCDPQKITGQNIQGAPDLVIEVLGPATAKKDHWEKKLLYEKHGVREYLLVEPEALYVMRYILGEDRQFGHYEVFGAREPLPLRSLEGIEIPLWEVFGIDKDQPEVKRGPRGR
ncbi:MAG: Uma2 family endonuclease [Candidatus Omnitrophica bacterium]|nr:Uma2 family endonuclease [Candidatus Omnitrophota bacterium]